MPYGIPKQAAQEYDNFHMSRPVRAPVAINYTCYKWSKILELKDYIFVLDRRAPSKKQHAVEYAV